MPCTQIKPLSVGASPSSRRAWIEMTACFNTAFGVVSPSSRRAWIEIIRLHAQKPAPLVALLAEGVDRNMRMQTFFPQKQVSPSSRRAWIEMCASILPRAAWWVALLAEGVDRNGNMYHVVTGVSGRPPRGGRG